MVKLVQIFQPHKLRYASKKILENNLSKQYYKELLLSELVNPTKFYSSKKSSCDCKKYAKKTTSCEQPKRGALPWEPCPPPPEPKTCTPFQNEDNDLPCYSPPVKAKTCEPCPTKQRPKFTGIPYQAYNLRPCKPFEGQGSGTRMQKTICEWRRMERCKKVCCDESKCYHGFAPDCSITRKVYPMRHAIQKKCLAGYPKPGWQRMK